VVHCSEECILLIPLIAAYSPWPPLDAAELVGDYSQQVGGAIPPIGRKNRTEQITRSQLCQINCCAGRASFRPLLSKLSPSLVRVPPT
jgi:hypothetical protein